MSHPTNSTIAADTIVAAACVFLLALIAILSHLYRKKKKNQTTSYTTTPKLPARSLPFFELTAATANFHPSLIVGKGPLGTVFKAAFSSAAAAFLAVKRIHPHLVLSHAGTLRFSSKLKSLSLLSGHPNVVPILGYCEAPGERIVVTAFVAGGRTLDSLLHGKGAEELSWRARARIAAGASRGIEHLHGGSTSEIVHGRVKASNILVGHDFAAAVCDYGLPEFLPVVGGEGGKEGDVYGFGVVLLELLSGRRSEGGLVAEWALPLIREGRIGEVLDGRIGLPKDVGPLVRMAKVASACVGNGRRSRPAMAQVAAILSSLEVEYCR